MLSARRRSLLLLVVGVGLLVNPYAPGVHVGEGSVYRYEAATVSYDRSTGLQATDPETGRELTLSDVDEDIACVGPSLRRLCQFEYAVHDGANVSAPPSNFVHARYEFVYLDDTLYRPTSVERGDEWYMGLDRVNDSDPLRRVADDGVRSPGAREAISTGSVMTYRALPEGGSIVRYEGRYYTLYTTGTKHYRGGASFCASGGDGFCSDADDKRWGDSILTVGSWVIGVLLVVAASRSRVRTR